MVKLIVPVLTAIAVLIALSLHDGVNGADAATKTKSKRMHNSNVFPYEAVPDPWDYAPGAGGYYPPPYPYPPYQPPYQPPTGGGYPYPPPPPTVVHIPGDVHIHRPPTHSYEPAPPPIIRYEPAPPPIIRYEPAPPPIIKYE